MKRVLFTLLSLLVPSLLAAAGEEPPRFLDAAHAARFTPAAVEADLARLAAHYQLPPADPSTWPTDLPEATPDQREAARMIKLVPVVAAAPASAMWTSKEVGDFASFERRRVMRSDDPLAAALVVAATAWAIDREPGIRQMRTDLYRAPALHGWLRLAARIGPDGALRDAPADPAEARRLAAALQLAGTHVLPLARAMREPMPFTRSEAYLRDLAHQRERLAAPPALSRERVSAALRRAAEWQHTSLWMVSGASDSPDADTSWYRGVFYAGLIPAHQATGDTYYLEKARALAARTGARLGLAALTTPDCVTIGQTYLDLYSLQPDAALLTPLRAKLDEILAHPVHRTPPTHYIDLVFMAAGTWGRLGNLSGDPRHHDYLRAFWRANRDKFRDPATGLFVRDATWLAQPDGFRLLERNSQPVFWGRGNGWALGGLAQVLLTLPATDPARAEFARDFQQLAAAVVAVQPPDGLWRASLGDPESYPLGETSGTALLAYGLLYGINAGILDPTTYRPPAERALAALLAVQESNGKLGYVQPGAESPRIPFYRGSNVEYATGALLLAGAEWLRLP